MAVLTEIFVLMFLGGSVFLLIWSIFRYPVPIEPPVHRLIAMKLGTGRRETIFEQPTLAPVVGMVLFVAKRMGFAALRNFVKRHLNASGNTNNYSIDEYIAICMFTGLLLAATTGLLAALMLGLSSAPGTIVAMGLLGFCVPLYVLYEQSLRRLQRISKRLPYTLDLVALMMDAGGTFTESIETVIRDDPADDFNQELRLVQAEIDFGTPRTQALANMAERIPLDSLRSVVGAVIQAETLGTPLATILKNQSGMLRMHRSVRAEKLSASASLRILIPSMLILIAVVFIVFGPLLVRWVNSGFSPTLG